MRFFGFLDSEKGRRKEVIKIGRDINEIKNRLKTERTNEAKICLFGMT